MTFNKNLPIYVVGHVNPDTDCVASAISYAHFLRERNKQKDIIAARAGPLNYETKFVLRYFHEKMPHLIETADKKNVILVDHNEINLALPGIRRANIMEIIDHHRIGDVETIYPIEFVNEPRGCTTSIIAERYFWFRVPITKRMAGLMLAAILSDTMLLNSPTTTRKDRALARKLAKIAGLNIHKFGRALLEAGCDLINHSPRKIILTDFKSYGEKGRRAGIGQVNVADSRIALKKKKAILKEMDRLRRKYSYRYIFLMITNIVSLQTDLLVSADDLDAVAKVFKKKVEHNTILMPHTVSRKQQVQPQVLELMKRQ
jgi:manganese-dependent inorganic pyrophosphatase